MTDISADAVERINDYDCGLINDYGGGNVDWWMDYLRAEIGRANDHWRDVARQLVPALSSDLEAMRARAEQAEARVAELEGAAKLVVDQDVKPEYSGRYSELRSMIGNLRAALSRGGVE